LNPFLWSQRIETSPIELSFPSGYKPEWRPYYTAFDCSNLVSDLGIVQSPKTVNHEYWQEGLQKLGRYEFNRDCIQKAPIEFRNNFCTLLWCPVQIYGYCPVKISLHGVIRDEELMTIGSGEISYKHGRRKAYNPRPLPLHSHPNNNNNHNHNQPVTWRVDNMVLFAWLGEHYWYHYLGQGWDCNVRPIRIYHADGNIHHNHLFNLLIIPADLDYENLTSETLTSILDRVEPIWREIEADEPYPMPGMTFKYARIVLEKRLLIQSTPEYHGRVNDNNNNDNNNNNNNNNNAN
jgi:hypothetical protein